MKPTIKIIRSESISSNSYLIETEKGFILIVTGRKINYSNLDMILSNLGCSAYHINLIIFTTHSISDYETYKYLKEKYNAEIALHILDKELINEKAHLFFYQKIMRFFKSLIFSSHEQAKFTPDLLIDEGYNLSEFGLNARVLYLPGYSKSIGILTENGELFCDDLKEPDHYEEYSISKPSGSYLKKLKKLFVDVVYPGQGEPLFLRINDI